MFSRGQEVGIDSDSNDSDRHQDMLYHKPCRTGDIARVWFRYVKEET